jgi:lipoprotein NlpI
VDILIFILTLQGKHIGYWVTRRTVDFAFIVLIKGMRLWLLLVLATVLSMSAQVNDPNVRDLYARGEEHFFAGRIDESIRNWDLEIVAQPFREPYHWQRGLAFYYAGEFEKGVKQFELHQKVNRNDVENAAWHFLCVVRAKGGSLKKARKALIPIAGDSRVPMKEVHDLFAGKGTAQDVLDAASKNAEGLLLRNQLCYAHLYLGLYHEALGEIEKSRRHIKKSAVEFRMDHYMGKWPNSTTSSGGSDLILSFSSPMIRRPTRSRRTVTSTSGLQILISWLSAVLAFAITTVLVLSAGRSAWQVGPC